MHSFGYGLAHVRSEAAPEAQALAENLRRQLEDSDYVQGLQCFVDGDSLFGGAAHNILQEFWEDAGSKVPVALFSIFSPLPAELQSCRGSYPSQPSSVPFANQRCEEVCLNRLLSTSLLSEPGSALYVPIEMGDWPSFFSNIDKMAPEGDSLNPSCSWLTTDAATAQYLAAIIDTALYGTRDGGSLAAADAQNSAIHDETGTGPAYYLGDWCQTLRPSPSWRVSALLGSLPLPVDPRFHPQHSGELWSFLQATPLLGFSEGAQVPNPRGFIPLSHTMPYAPLSSAGKVVGHALTLRGAGVLPSRVYPPAEAMLRYAMPLRTSAYLPLLTRQNYPISSTFPLELLSGLKSNPTASAKASKASNSFSRSLDSTDVGSHVVTTFNSSPMLDRIVREAQKALRYKSQTYCTSYWMEEGDWKERIEDVLEIRDDYHHGNDDGDDLDFED
ncbi:unnamed protein product [Phytomonas sp. Hart1]|nr:unnamed protein product [Phytomonas sp. Hart1]|eukprot:CCW67185.1 unnamed protein product [Phytomonas sp. isolate Hart1]